MKLPPAAAVIFSLRTFAAAMLALYISYRLDLARPTWAFITSYIVAAPLRGAGRSKGLYRICGTILGAVFTVIAIPNLDDAPELLVLTLSLWVAGCLYLSILDGTPRSYALMLAGYTTALIGFPSVNAPLGIFDTAISRSEEIGVAILCVELMNYLPFTQRAGDVLRTRIEKCLLDTRALAINLMTLNPAPISIADRARIMIDVVNLSALRVQARYDTPHFAEIEGWVVQMQRHLRDFFAELVTFDAQLRKAEADAPQLLQDMKPLTAEILAWIESGHIKIPQKLHDLIGSMGNGEKHQALAKSGILDTLAAIVARRGECLVLRQKILAREPAGADYMPIAPFIDYRQAAFYGIAVALQLSIGCSFWMLTGWPEGGIMAMITTVICCFFASLEAPPTIAFIFLIATIIGSAIGWLYNFVVFPHIEGFPLLVFVLGFSCIPIGIGMANPKFGGIMLPLILGINLADMQNRYEANIVSFLNGFIAQSIGILAAGVMLSFVRAASMESSTRRFVEENGHSLALLSDMAADGSNEVMDRLTHRSALALVRSPALRDQCDGVRARILMDLQAAVALMQLRELAPKMAPDLQQKLRGIRTRLVAHFATRHGVKDAPDHLGAEIGAFRQKIDSAPHNRDTLRLMGLLETLDRGVGQEAA